MSAEEFEKIDFRVMGHAYASQNALGRLCDESAYQGDLAARLLGDGLRFVHTEVPVTVTHRDFSKQYFLDLVVENALYELKARNAFTGEDETQLLMKGEVLPAGTSWQGIPASLEGRKLAAE